MRKIFNLIFIGNREILPSFEISMRIGIANSCPKTSTISSLVIEISQIKLKTDPFKKNTLLGIGFKLGLGLLKLVLGLGLLKLGLGVGLLETRVRVLKKARVWIIEIRDKHLIKNVKPLDDVKGKQQHSWPVMWSPQSIFLHIRPELSFRGQLRFPTE